LQTDQGCVQRPRLSNSLERLSSEGEVKSETESRLPLFSILQMKYEYGTCVPAVRLMLDGVVDVLCARGLLVA
jgi:hypothetical protein